MGLLDGAADPSLMGLLGPAQGAQPGAGLLGAAPPDAPMEMLQNPMISAFTRNQAFVRPGQNTYNTPLQPQEEQAFRGWLGQNKVPFDANASLSDYDMRGFWRGLQAGDPRAMSAIDPNDNQLHYPDYWKTPLHQTFSNESQWATQDAPHWTNDDKLIDKFGRVIFDDRAQRKGR